MKVRCIDKLGAWCLEMNTVYTVVHDLGDVYMLEGVSGEWYKSRFEVVEEDGTKEDVVSSPKHYQLFPGIEVVDIRDRLLDKIESSKILPMKHKEAGYYSEMMGYLMRCMDKNGLQDMKKARWYLDRLINSLEGKNG